MIVLVSASLLAVFCVSGFAAFRDRYMTRDPAIGEPCLTGCVESSSRPSAITALVSATTYRFLRIITLPMLRLLFKFSVQPPGTRDDFGACIVAANHSSFLDAVVLQAAFPRRISFFMTERYYNPLLFRWLFRLMHCIPLRETTGPNTSAIRTGLSVLRSGGVLGIFPEGGISRNGDLRDGMPGCLLLASKSRVPVLPVFISGTYEALPRHACLPKISRITVTFGAPLSYELLSEGISGRAGVQRGTENLMNAISSLSTAPRS